MRVARAAIAYGIQNGRRATVRRATVDALSAPRGACSLPATRPAPSWRAMTFPRELETARLVLRAPREDDAEAIFARYASDGEVTRMLGWPRHRSLDDTRDFLAFAARQRDEGSSFVYLVTAR